MGCPATLFLFDYGADDQPADFPRAVMARCDVTGHHTTAELGRAMHHETLILPGGDHSDVWWTQPGYDQGDQADADKWRRAAGT